MRANSRTDILLSPLFLVGLGLLLLNDFVLKYEFSNELTGKLSDFAGLFTFPFFFSVLFPKYNKLIYFLTIPVFCFWNSSISQELIEFLNNNGVRVGRTIDSTDFIAFGILPFSYLHFKTQLFKPKIGLFIPAKVVICSVAVFSFIATTLPRQEAKLGINSGKTFVLDMDKEEFFNNLQTGYGMSDTLELNLIDSLFYLHYYVPDIKSDMRVLANIEELDSKTVIRIDSILTGIVTGSLFSGVDEDDIRMLKDVGQTEHEGYFETYFINQLLEQTDEPRRLYYDNKRIYDELIKQYK